MSNKHKEERSWTKYAKHTLIGIVAGVSALGMSPSEQPDNEAISLPTDMKTKIAEQYDCSSYEEFTSKFNEFHVRYRADFDDDNIAELAVVDVKERDSHYIPGHTTEDGEKIYHNYGEFIVYTDDSGKTTVDQPKTPHKTNPAHVKLGYMHQYRGDIDGDSVEEIYAIQKNGSYEEGYVFTDAIYDFEDGKIEKTGTHNIEDPEKTVGKQQIGSKLHKEMESI